MATYEITAVRTEQPPGYSHEHITHVGIGAQRHVLRRETVITDLRNPNGDRYITRAKGIRADVLVVGCPACGFGDYITTSRDSTTANNLLSLPRV